MVDILDILSRSALVQACKHGLGNDNEEHNEQQFLDMASTSLYIRR